MKVLLVDNNDSFTYNIVELLNKVNGVDLDVILHNKVKLADLLAYNRVIISPGPQTPSDYPILFSILNELGGKVTILGICLGHQAICSYYGARLECLNKVVHGERTIIYCEQNSVLFKGINEMYVGRYHSWVAKEPINKNLQVIATDTSNNIMAVEDKEKRIFGVQFHPESYMSQNGLQILKNFIYCQ